MAALEILFIAGIAGAAPGLLLLAFGQRLQESFVLAALLAAGFWAFSLITAAREGVLGFVLNHTQNLWGAQVWYDLVIAVSIALIFIVPRARSAGMNVPLWVIGCGLSASLALLSMVARLWWLERKQA